MITRVRSDYVGMLRFAEHWSKGFNEASNYRHKNTYASQKPPPTTKQTTKANNKQKTKRMWHHYESH